MMRRWGVTAFMVVAVMVMWPAGHAGADGARLGFDFDAGPDGRTASEPWSHGCFRSVTGPLGCVTTSGGVGLAPVERDGGVAGRFPSKGSAVIHVAHDEAFNPRQSDFSITALVRVTSGSNEAGANIIQKGRYDDAGGQWKLQVDSGVPSCRVSGRTESTAQAAEVRAPSSLTADHWTKLHCQREGSQLRLFLDGAETDTVGGADMEVHNLDPVLIGGNHSGPGNDQFRGDLDDVNLSID